MAALLRFNFNYDDLIRWLQGPCTHAHWQWTALSNLFDTVKQARSPQGWPNIQHQCTEAVLQQDVPLQGHCACSWTSAIARNLHPLSPPT